MSDELRPNRSSELSMKIAELIVLNTPNTKEGLEETIRALKENLDAAVSIAHKHGIPFEQFGVVFA